VLYRGWLFTRILKDARDVWAVAQDKEATAAKDAWLRAAAESVRTMHRLGLEHDDLNLKNILVRREGGRWRGYIIDFDKSRLYTGEVPRERAERNVARLRRSILKLDPAQRFITGADWEFFVTAYREAG
jgi:tRNA A-37 threonylcarbamoyl transferase component Bud32